MGKTYRGPAVGETFKLDDLQGRDFATVSEAAAILRADQRTVRRRCADGTIPAIKIPDWRIPVRWLREAAGAVAA